MEQPRILPSIRNPLEISRSGVLGHGTKLPWGVGGWKRAVRVHGCVKEGGGGGGGHAHEREKTPRPLAHSDWLISCGDRLCLGQRN
ncbi:hypothetical protein CDAR_526801 [Caerostris darwini]|uniref:Dihydrofolate reductase n=1 Tax=Caerostris darwini TaxID=1538125 RepID=A0AAV4Q6T1_9ARAC|nr:hypothetical protein CDAR_526801 [Caerostris darwini]